MLKSITTHTPNGDFHIIVNDKDIALGSGFGSVTELIKRLNISSQVIMLKEHPYQNLVTDYYGRNFGALDKIPRVQKGTTFQEKVWISLKDIPPGQPLSYGQLAEKIGHPKASRAVGTACGKNLLPLLVPCHRVIRSDGSVGNYLYGLEIKQSLLALEK